MAGALDDYDLQGHTEWIISYPGKNGDWVLLRLWFTRLSTGEKVTEDTYSINYRTHTRA
jgi:hypothetical protein